MSRLFKLVLSSNDGASAAEYALILGILGAAIAVASFTLGSNISNSMNAAKDEIATCGGGC